MTKSNLLTMASILLFVCAAPPALYLIKKHQAASAPTDSAESRELRNSSAFAAILGEFRTNINDILFIKTERYLHSGVAFSSHIDETALASSGEAKEKEVGTENSLDKNLSSGVMQESVSIKPGTTQSHDDNSHEGHDHDHNRDSHSGESSSHTLIPDHKDDYRGFIGDLERQVKPWQDANAPHVHTAGTELLPWYRIATLTNPHGIKNYMIGTWWLKSLKNDSQTEEALKFISEGIKNNPDAYDLYLMKGYVYRQLGKDAEALDSFKKSVDVALKKRPRFGIPTDKSVTKNTWDTTDEEQFAGALTMVSALTRNLNGSDEAIKYIDQYSKYFQDPGLIDRIKASAKN